MHVKESPTWSKVIEGAPTNHIADLVRRNPEVIKLVNKIMIPFIGKKIIKNKKKRKEKRIIVIASPISSW